MRAQKPATIYLLRHGHSTANAKSVLAGRDFKVSLSSTGKKQALAVQAELSGKVFAKIKTVQVAVSMETKKSRPLTDAEREFLSRYQESN